MSLRIVSRNGKVLAMVVDEFTLPDDFNPSFSKNYQMGNNSLEVRVQYRGIVEEDSAPVHQWAYVVLVHGLQINAGLFHWDPSERELKDENVANHLASFWGPSELVTQANQDVQNLYTPEMQAVALVNHLFYRSTDVDFEVIWFSKFGDAWRTLLAVETDGRYYEVLHSASGVTTVDAYSQVDDYSISQERLMAILRDIEK
jgi:hypothetical protein